MTTRLPAALAPWTAALDALTPELATALGPLLRGIEDLVTTREPRPAPDGEPDGYDGLTRRGRPERLLVSEWLLAAELPDEFTRRAVQRELLHLAPARRDDRPRGRVVVIADAGPSAAGAARLVHLVALIVLGRRAASQGTDLHLATVGGSALKSAALPVLLPLWLRARTDADPTPEAVADILAILEPEDEPWILASDRLAAAQTGRRRMLSAVESAWGPNGATAVRISLSGARRELPLPPGPIAVSALRGNEFRGRQQHPQPPVRLSHPAFLGDDRHVVARTDRANVIATLNIKSSDPRWKRYVCRGPVLAASWHRSRLVLLTSVRDQLEVRVIGRLMPHLETIRQPLHELGLDGEPSDGPLEPIFFDDEDKSLTCHLGGRWVTLRAEREPEFDVAPRSVPPDLPHNNVELRDGHVIVTDAETDEVLLRKRATL